MRLDMNGGDNEGTSCYPDTPAVQSLNGFVG